MKLNRLRVSNEVSLRLTHLKGRTGLTPNILCRIGFCLSLSDLTVPDPDHYPPDSDREIDRHTLTGPWDAFFVALIKERCLQDHLDVSEENLALYFRAHVNRGVLLLHKRTRSLHDLALLMPRNICAGAGTETAGDAEDVEDTEDVEDAEDENDAAEMTDEEADKDV